MQIPEVDISQPIEVIAPQLIHACQNIGFVTLKNHGIEYHKLIEFASNFFAQSEKEKNVYSRKIYRGYFPSTLNGKEGLDMSNPEVPQNNKWFSNTFPNNPTDRKLIQGYFKKLHQLAVKLLNCLNIKVDLDILKCVSTLRFNYYPGGITPVEFSNQNVPLSCEEHFDNCLCTLLYQDVSGGLEIFDTKEKKWMAIPFRPNQLIINTGTALENISNGEYPATLHRVSYCNHKRLSIPFFFEPPLDLKLTQNLDYKTHIEKCNQKFKEYQGT